MKKLFFLALVALLTAPASGQTQLRRGERLLEKKFLLGRLNSVSSIPWQMEWDDTVERVRQLRSGLLRLPAGQLEAVAEQFVRQQGELLDIPASTELALVERKQSLSGTHVHFEQRYRGLRIEGTQISLHLDPAGRLFWINNQSASADRVANQIRLNEPGALSLVLQDLKPDLTTLRAPGRAELVFAPRAGALIHAWEVSVAANDPLGDWIYLVDAESGTILEKRDLLQFARGRVLFPNPIVTLKNPGLRDLAAQDSGRNQTTAEANCDRSAVPLSAYREVELLGLSASSGMLDGEFVSTGGSGVPSDIRAKGNPDFVYERCDSRFNEVNAYYTIDSIQRYIHLIGFNGVNNRSIRVNASGFINFGRSQDNSFYSPSTKELVFGLGGIHDAEDGEIVAHEYGHSIQDNQIPGFGRSPEALALGEGFGDTLAALFFVPFSDGFHDELVGEWDASFYNGNVPVPFLRAVDGTRTFLNFDLAGDEHRNGTIWSGALWQFFIRSGRNLEARDRLMRLLLESQFLYRSDASFAEAAQALITVDEKLTKGANKALLLEIFGERKILRNNLPMPQLAETESNDSVATAQVLSENQFVISGEISANNDVDFYRFPARANQLYVIEIFATRSVPRSSLDSFLSVLDVNGNSIPQGSGFLENDDIREGVIQDSRLVFTSRNTENLIIRVSSYSREPNQGESKGPYTLVIYPTTSALRIPRVSSDTGTFTGIALSNSGSTDALVGLILLDRDGQLISADNPQIFTLGAGKQMAVLDTELFGYKSLAAGWLEIHSSSEAVKGIFLYGNSGSLPGSDASATTSSDSVFLLAGASDPATGIETEINLVNPNAASANVELRVYKNSGEAALPQPVLLTISPFGHARRLLSEFVTAPLASGYIRVRSDQPVAGFEIHGDQRRTGLRLRGVSEAGSSTVMYVPHFAELPLGGGVRLFTILNLVNPTAQDLQLTLTAFNDGGQRFEELSSVLVTLRPNESREISVLQLFGITNLVKSYVGSIEIRSFYAGLMGSVRFGQTDNKYLVAVPIETVPKSRIVFSQAAHGSAGDSFYLTGIALLNPNAQLGFYTVKVFTPDGKLVAQSASLALLTPRQRVVRLLNELVPDLKPILGGYIVIESSVPLLSFELVVLPDSLTAVPPQ
jgi:hypothetical protein